MINGFDGYGFEADEPVPTVEPDIYTDEAEDTEGRDLREPDRLASELICRFLQRVVIPGKPLLTGQVLHVLAFLAGQTEFRTKAELAKALKVSAGRVSQILKEIPCELRVALRHGAKVSDYR